MKRRVFRLGLLLLLGAIINVAVTWGCALLTNPNHGYSRSGHHVFGTGNHWVTFELSTLGMSRIVSWVPAAAYTLSKSPLAVQPEDAESLLKSWSRIRKPALPEDSAIKLRTSGTMHMLCGPSHIMLDQAYGWPFRSMWCGWGMPDSYAYVTVPVTPQPIVQGIELSPPNALGVGGRALPKGVLWLGFALNTLLYGAAFLVLPRLIRVVRASLRHQRGMCPNCGYDLRENGQTRARYMLDRGCPECGWKRSF